MKTEIYLSFGYIPYEGVLHLCNYLALTPESFVQRKQYDCWSCSLNKLTDAEICLEQVMKLADVFDVSVGTDWVDLDYVLEGL